MERRRRKDAYSSGYSSGSGTGCTQAGASTTRPHRLCACGGCQLPQGGFTLNARPGNIHAEVITLHALRKGCRCLEIDCWDGPDLEPIVYHGYTLTSKILFRDVISTIAEHAFQQQVMAQYITTILGDRLLDAGLDLSSSAELPSPQKGKVKVAVELSNLVIYTKSVKFVSFSHSRESQRFYENTSLGEKKAHKLALKSGPEFVLHNARFISRIYPAGSRTLSSNYNPQEFWNMGSQLVALNFQSLGLPMDLNNARFRDNGGCGYVLKPHFLRSHEATFDPSALPPDLKPVQVLMKVISGSNLPISKAGKPIDPYVRVEITGVPADCRRIQSEPVKAQL
ncbi:hypothetical protein ANANG_G00144090 [Anguilla anguilla]|uniref:Phosphoinositide phospholipase C n=1 Tax=Anguilla anguilla TaxID=7936 RepID=A0A9D3MD21_ANGAN|nr:hypothetical protein ANANG_G00144090 [Anguilla anguilla]